MIVALSKAARVFGSDYYKDIATKTADFILSTMKKDEQLYHRFRNGDVAFSAFLEDYTFMIWGLVELYQSGFETKYLKYALILNQELIEHFWDADSGGFFHTRDDGEKLIFRNKEIYDGAIPSGNSVAALNLLQLGRITSNFELEEKAQQIMKAFSKQASEIPMGHTQLMSALDFAIGPSTEIVVVGKENIEETKNVISQINDYFIPNKVLIFQPAEKAVDTDVFPDYVNDMRMIDGKTTVHICQNYNCNLPLNNIREIQAQLEKLN
jgi:uncharacterized protein YyaL (SSP411 family)